MWVHYTRIQMQLKNFQFPEKVQIVLSEQFHYHMTELDGKKLANVLNGCQSNAKLYVHVQCNLYV